MVSMKAKSRAVEVRAVVFQEGDWWSAQCLEYDIATQAATLGDLRREIERVLAAYVVLAAKQDRNPFEGLQRAPEKFWEMYERARTVPALQTEYDLGDTAQTIVPHLRIVEGTRSII
jgi:hypothetical protein